MSSYSAKFLMSSSKGFDATWLWSNTLRIRCLGFWVIAQDASELPHPHTIAWNLLFSLRNASLAQRDYNAL